MRVLITGAAGFIGSALARHLVFESEHDVLVFDKLTYAGSMSNLQPVAQSHRFQFVQGDICDVAAVTDAFRAFDPDCVVHLAAESHVDRSIDGPADFIQTNIVGTFVLLQVALEQFRKLSPDPRLKYRIKHVHFGHRGVIIILIYILKPIHNPRPATQMQIVPRAVNGKSLNHL
jgi:dTDP-glucose 4,6-dehydratase